MRSSAVLDSQDSKPHWQCAAPTRIGTMRWVLIGVGIVAIAMAIWLLPITEWTRNAVVWTADHGVVGVLIFVGLYTLLVTLAVPVTPLNLGAGVLFGVWIGTVAALAGSLGAAVASFLLSRFLLQNWVRRQLACYPKYRAIIEGVHENRWSVMLAIRLHPLLPASLKNYAFGLTDLSLRFYVVATALAYLPAVFLYAWLGSAGYTSLDDGRDWSTANLLLHGLGLLAAITATVALTWYGKRKLEELQRERESQETVPPV